ncbi:MAG: hydroxymethylglutaryl-CoA lyase [Chitinophagaceae bacterium]|nr:hydroxymethylglutaryl-CoA lyase [Chitinophagaceae bacterium]
MSLVNQQLSIIECPRDAMQGWHHFIETSDKIKYINSLLKVGFDTIDFGSFVSHKAIPQMADTKEVIGGLKLETTSAKLLAIVANMRGAEEAMQYDGITYLGFPFSISPTFQLRNTNSSMEESLGRVEDIQELCTRYNKTLVVYLSMGFGNPYSDLYNDEILLKWTDEIIKRKIKIISLADTVGLATPEQISFALNNLIPAYPDTVIGVHLHSSPVNRKEKFLAAFNAGCKRFDGALRGIGGCPMAQDELVGNMNTEEMIGYLDELNTPLNIDHSALADSLLMATKIFT